MNVFQNSGVYCSVDPTRLLLTFGASSSIVDRLYGNTAMHWAVQAKNCIAIGVLLNHGASPFIENDMVRCLFNVPCNLYCFMIS